MIMKQIGRRCAMAAGVALSLLLAGSAAAAPELDNFEFLQTSSVRVVTYYPGQVAFGTGWIATASEARNANNAVIVTAAHIVRGANRITILEANSAEEHEANVRAIDLDRDLAFLEVRGLRSGGTPLRVTTVVPPIGQELRTTGYTSASDRPSRRELAEVSGVLMGAYSRSIPNPRPIWEYADVGVAQFQHSITLSPGFSGGPVIDKCGRVVGINVSNGTEVRVPGGSLDLAPGISFAVASAEIIKAAQDNGIRLLEDASACPEAAAAPSPPPEETQPPARPWYRGPVEFMQSRTGVALLVGLLALIALGTAAWLFFGKSGPARREAEPEPQPDSPRSVTPTGPVLDEAASGALTLTGRGPGGESVNLRFSADELKSSARTLGTEGQAHIPDTRAKTLVSRTHAELSFDGTHFQIQDLKSTNGTKLDGQALAPFEKRRLHDGASIVLADVTLSVRVD
jgi:hypothetical protein